MSSTSQYFAKAPLRGPGMLHFLVTPTAAPQGSAARALLGSLVDEVDVGLFGTKEMPGTEHVWKREYVLQTIAKDPALAQQSLIQTDNLASTRQTLAINRKFKLGVGAPIPGVPANASIGIDYTKLRTVEVVLGKGCSKHYIPTGFLKSGFEFAQSQSDQFDRQLFHDDYMAVRQILIVQNLSLTVESETEFSASFDAKASEINNLNVGVSYQRKTTRRYEIVIDDGQDYLFGIGAVQLDRIRD